MLLAVEISLSNPAVGQDGSHHTDSHVEEYFPLRSPIEFSRAMCRASDYSMSVKVAEIWSKQKTFCLSLKCDLCPPLTMLCFNSDAVKKETEYIFMLFPFRPISFAQVSANGRSTKVSQTMLMILKTDRTQASSFTQPMGQLGEPGDCSLDLF